ncbi:hypothetical protein M0805_008231 [Coniferiporia weirii]|nr:hypothetical protein M0805_008231 [Coniferiporia weirii]
MSTYPDEPTQPSDSSPIELHQPKMPLRTTTNAVVTSVDDTPVRARSVDHHSYRNRSLDERQTAIVDDLRHSIPEADLKSFHSIHYRVIFEDVAEPIHKVMDLRNHVIVSLKNCTKVLGYMHKAGWVHHDISCGDVYPYKRDLEYARRIRTSGKREVRTGTLEFIAIEVTTCNYIHLPRKPAKTALLAMISKTMKGIEEPDVKQDIQSMSHLEFYYNDLHDLESIWWIPIWMLFFHDDKAHSETDDLKKANRSLRTRQLFPRNLHTLDRRDFLTNELTFAKVTSCLPKSYTRVLVLLDVIRAYLIGAYDEVEAALPVAKRPVHNEVHDFYDLSWDALLGLAEGIVLIPNKLSSARKATEVPFTNDLSPAPAP